MDTEIGQYKDTYLLSKALQDNLDDNIIFFCVGTPKVYADAVAPMIGSTLVANGYTNVMGTLEDPIHALNLNEKIKLIPKGYTVVAIDCCLGKPHLIGQIAFMSEGLLPGKAVGKKLTAVGDFSLKIIVNSSRYYNCPNEALLFTPTEIVDKLAHTCSEAIMLAYPIKELNYQDTYSNTFTM